MNENFLNVFKEMNEKNEEAINTLKTKLDNSEIDQIKYDEEIKKLNDSLIYFAKTNIKAANEIIKEKLNYEINIYIEIDEINIEEKEIKTLAVKNNQEYQMMLDEINNLINNTNLSSDEKEQINTCLMIINLFHQEALSNATKRQDFVKIKAEVEGKKKEVKEEKAKIKATFFQRFFPTIIFVIVLILLYLFYIFFY